MVGNYFLSLTKLWASLTWKSSINTTIITKFYIRSSAQQILRTVAESFRSYYSLIQAYREGKISDRPRIPNYRKKGGMAAVSYPAQALKLKGNQIRVPLGNTCKRWFGLDCFLIHKPSIRAFSTLKELSLLPRNKCFYWEFIYEKEVVKPQLDRDNVLGIDHGLNNWLTCISNLGTSAGSRWETD